MKSIVFANPARKKDGMNIIKVTARLLLALGVGCGCWLLLLKARAAGAYSPVPPAIESGFALLPNGVGIDGALNVWQKGGLLEGDSKVSNLANYLRRVSQSAGDYQSHEVLQTKPIGRSSQVLYLVIHFERAAVYGRFLLYRSQKGWVVQNMDFSTRPEAIMPWLAFEGDRTTEQ
jgi:hypothetical protein